MTVTGFAGQSWACAVDQTANPRAAMAKLRFHPFIEVSSTYCAKTFLEQDGIFTHQKTISGLRVLSPMFNFSMR
jgi:hypothetical protein